MDLTLSGYSGSRGLGKAVRRIQPVLETLEQALASEPVDVQRYAGLTIWLTDNPLGFFAEEPLPKEASGVLVWVGLDPTLKFSPDDDVRLVGHYVDQLDFVLGQIPIGEDCRQRLRTVVSTWRKQL